MTERAEPPADEVTGLADLLITNAMQFEALGRVRRTNPINGPPQELASRRDGGNLDSEIERIKLATTAAVLL